MKRFLFFLILSLILPVAGALAASAAPAPQRYIPSLIRISDDAAIAALEEDGAKVWHRRGDIIIAFLPDDPATATGAMTGCQYNGSVPSTMMGHPACAASPRCGADRALAASQPVA